MSKNTQRNRKPVLLMAIESIKVMIKNLESNPNIQEHSKVVLKEFLNSFVKLFGKTAKYEE